MIRENNLVKNHVRLSPLFVFENDTLFNALEIMKNYGSNNISVIKEDFSISGCLSKHEILKILDTKFNNNINTLTTTKISEQDIKYENPIVLYPGTSIFDAYILMKYFENKYLPVVDVPWEKKIIGFLWLNDILPIVEKTYMKIPV